MVLTCFTDILSHKLLKTSSFPRISVNYCLFPLKQEHKNNIWTIQIRLNGNKENKTCENGGHRDIPKSSRQQQDLCNVKTLQSKSQRRKRVNKPLWLENPLHSMFPLQTQKDTEAPRNSPWVKNHSTLRSTTPARTPSQHLSLKFWIVPIQFRT